MSDVLDKMTKVKKPVLSFEMLIISLLSSPISGVIELLIGVVRWPSWQETPRSGVAETGNGEPRHQFQPRLQSGGCAGLDDGNASSKPEGNAHKNSFINLLISFIFLYRTAKGSKFEHINQTIFINHDINKISNLIVSNSRLFYGEMAQSALIRI